MAKHKHARNKRKSDKFLKPHPEGRKKWAREKTAMRLKKKHEGHDCALSTRQKNVPGV